MMLFGNQPLFVMKRKLISSLMPEKELSILPSLPKTVEIEVIDEGPGIPNIELAMQQGYSTADQQIREMGFGAGMGLHNIKCYSDKFDISSEVDKGTFLKMIINTP